MRVVGVLRVVVGLCGWLLLVAVVVLGVLMRVWWWGRGVAPRDCDRPTAQNATNSRTPDTCPRSHRFRCAGGIHSC